MDFNPTKTKNQFNKCVDFHKKNGGARTQLRPKIKSIGPRKAMEGREDYRKLKYETGQEFMMDESSIAGLVHAYSTLVALLTGNFNLVAIPFYFEDATPRARGLAPSAALSPYASFAIRIGMGFLFASFKSAKGKKDSEEISHEIHDGIRDAHPKFCK